jgi:hypothetical protein
MTSGLIGTPSYISPEQLSGARPTSAVDIFAWAVTMIFAATGHPAFGGDTVVAVMHRILNGQPDVSGVPPSLLPVIRQCLSKDPSQRPTARDLLLRLVDPSLAGTGRLVDPSLAGTGRLVDPSLAGTGRLVDPSVAGTGPLADDDVAVRTGSVPELAGSTGSGYGPIWPPPASTRPARRSRRGPFLAGGAAALAAVIVAGVLLLTRGSPGSTSHGAASSTPASSSPTGQASTPATATAQAAGATIPSLFAGTWAGTATMFAIGAPSLGLTNSISFTLANGGTTAHEVNDGCVNTLTLTKATATVLTFNEPGNALCVAGTVTFTLHGSDLAYVWTDGIEKNVATLRKHK